MVPRGEVNSLPSKKHLTSSTKCGKIYMKRRRTLHKPERANAMKKVSLQSLVSYLTSTGALPEIREEIVTELAKSEAKAQANRDMYAEATPIVLGALSATPVTIGELYDEIKGNLPDGFTKGKVQYLVTRVLTDKVTKVEGKVNTYTLKV